MSSRTGEQDEAVLYIISGAADVAIGKLRGTLTSHDFVHVPVGTDYTVSSQSGESLLLQCGMQTGVLVENEGHAERGE